VDKKLIQTDEWPMVSMQGVRYAKNPNQTPPKPVLRCMRNDDNDAGGKMVTRFMKGEKKYGPGGIWTKHRPNTLPRQAIALGDWFNVDFNFESFTPADQAWRLA
jgi:hypothetical protein